MEPFLVHFTYSGLVLVLLATGLGLPIPEDVPLLAAGYLCHQGVIDLRLTIPLAALAILASDSLLYYFGQRHGRKLTGHSLGRFGLTPERFARAEAAFQYHCGKTLFISRFLPGVRAAMFFAAGAMHISYWKLVLYDGMAIVLSVPTLIVLGWWFSGEFARVSHDAHRLQVVLILLLALAAAGYGTYRWLYPVHHDDA